MNAGAGGFAGAPVTKFILAGSISSSVILQAAHGFQRRPSPYLHFLTQSLVFRHPGELACGTLLLYYFRLLERQRGSAKHGACVASTLAISYALQSVVSAVLSTALPSGPYGLIFANFVPFTLSIPPAQHFTLFGLPMTDKASTRHQSHPTQMASLSAHLPELGYMARVCRGQEVSLLQSKITVSLLSPSGCVAGICVLGWPAIACVILVTKCVSWQLWALSWHGIPVQLPWGQTPEGSISSPTSLLTAVADAYIPQACC